MKNKKLLFGLIAILVIVSGYFVWNRYGDEIISRISPTPTLPPEPTTPTDIGVLEQPQDLSNWKQSSISNNYLWTFKYPNEWNEIVHNIDSSYYYDNGSYGLNVNQTSEDQFRNLVESYFTNDSYQILRYEKATLQNADGNIYFLAKNDFENGNKLGTSISVFIENIEIKENDVCNQNGIAVLWTDRYSQYGVDENFYDELKSIVSTIKFLPCPD